MNFFRDCPECSAPFETVSAVRRLCIHCSTALEKSRAPAQQAARTAIKNGALIRQPCEVCGAERVHAHHDDYSKPLAVRWLCPTHHRQHHTAKQRAQGAAQ